MSPRRAGIGQRTRGLQSQARKIQRCRTEVGVMASFTYPGVYIEELSSGQHTITGVATSIGAFVGWAPQGPVTEATLIESWSDYVAQFGGLDARSWLGYAVNQFFANGGSQCYIIRLVWAEGMEGGVNSPVASATALAAGVGYGTGTITATLGTGTSAVSGTITLGVGTPVLESIAVTAQGLPGTTVLPPLPYGATLQLAAAGEFSDGSSSAPPGVEWDTSDPTIASVSPAGVLTATGANSGPVTVYATSGIIQGSMTLTVTPAQIKTITVTPASLTVVVGQTVQLAATATYSDGTAPDITSIAQFTCAAAGVVTFSTTTPGQFTAAATNAGTTISAALPAIFTLPAAPTTTVAALTVGAATVVSIAMSPANATVPLPGNLEAGQTESAGFTVTTTMSDGSTGTTPTVTWTSSNPAVAAFDAAETAAISEYAIGTDVVTFTYTAVNPLTAGESVTLSGFPTSTFFNGQVVVVLASGLTATTFEADFTHADVASTAEAGVATVSAGSITVASAGTTTITASFTPSGSSTPVTASTQLTVNAGHLTGLSVSPATLTLAAGLAQQLTATGTFDTGTFVNMTGYATWSVASGTAATVSATGLVTAAAAGTATIQASWMGTNATATVTVTAAVPVSLAISTSPAAQTSVPAGQNLSLVAKATMSDGTTPTVTNTATWTSSSPLLTIAGPGVVSAAATAGGSLTLFANSPGVWGNSLLVTVTPQASNPSRFSLLLQQVTSTGSIATLESYVNLSTLSTDQSYVVTVIDNDSSYITFINPLTGLVVPPTGTPAAATQVPFSGGLDGSVLNPMDGNFEAALFPPANPNNGVHLLDRVDIFNLLCVPGETDAPNLALLQAYCVQKRAFLIVDSPQNTAIADMIQSGPVGSTPGSITDQSTAINSAMYFPWIEAPDPLTSGRSRLFPPCGFVAGQYAAADAARGVWKAPAGIQAALVGNSGLQFLMTDTENGGLNPQAVNCLREFKLYGDVVWGARTLAGNDQAGSQWKYVPIKRLALYLESSLYDGTQWVVFEPNDATLWGQIRMNVGTFLQGLFLQGAFAGTTPAQAYFVKCDAENNPPSSVALGVVNILVGFAPLYPAEFVVIQIQQIVAQAS
jgi:phage tail sheath protein FI